MTPAEQRAYQRAYYEANREAIAARKREYRKTAKPRPWVGKWDPAQSEAAAVDPVMSYEEIAAELGVTKARIGQIIEGALRKLRREHPELAELLR